ncbi:hypothetical protein Ocin01_05623 [Orchesella cincta]|uniref:Uncharacterized protein n=1 Tax=Orchesella cincta TaxID=48709 RepID=A0A1D2N7J5_ORCCI|nr:hypothetical protein Ocin01_05623 [Orchesella cincta]
MRLVILKCLLFVLLVVFICISPARCQDDDEEDEDTYDEEGESESTTTRRYRIRSSTVATSNSEKNDTQVQSASATEKAAASVPSTATSSSSAVTSAPVVAPPPVTQAARTTVRTTTVSDYEDEEGTTEAEEEGYAYIFRPLNKLVDNIVAGNVTGIVDNALSIRTPPEIRAFVNNVMSNVFNAGVGSALRQFMPSIFSTRAPPTSSPSRDPIPTQTSKKNAEPLAAIVKGFEGRTNDTEGNAPPAKKTMEIAYAGHPGSPASRLKCEIIS